MLPQHLCGVATWFPRCFAPLTPVHLPVVEQWQGSYPAIPCSCPRCYLVPTSYPSTSATTRCCFFLPPQPALSLFSDDQLLCTPCFRADERLRSPTSTGRIMAFQPASRHSAARSEYFAHFRSWVPRSYILEDRVDIFFSVY